MCAGPFATQKRNQNIILYQTNRANQTSQSFDVKNFGCKNQCFFLMLAPRRGAFSSYYPLFLLFKNDNTIQMSESVFVNSIFPDFPPYTSECIQDGRLAGPPRKDQIKIS